MFRRLIFVMIPLIFKGNPGLQLSFLVFFSSLYLIWYTAIWPHDLKKLVYIEIVNECFFMLLNYHMLVFTLFNPDLETQYYMGWSYLVSMGLLILINLIYVATNVFLKASRTRHLKKLREQKLARIAAMKEDQEEDNETNGTESGEDSSRSVLLMHRSPRVPKKTIHLFAQKPQRKSVKTPRKKQPKRAVLDTIREEETLEDAIVEPVVMPISPIKSIF